LRVQTYHTIQEFLAFRKQKPPALERLSGVLGQFLDDAKWGKRPDAASLVSAAEEVVAMVDRFHRIDPEDEGPSVLMINAFSSGQEPETFSLEDHLLNTAALSTYLYLDRFGERQRLVRLALAALVHDVGMALLPSEIFSYGDTQLKPEELESLSRHTLESASLLASWDEPLASLAEVVAQEHERFDGSGYPRGLAGEEISLEARILGLVDTYEAMTHRRFYKTLQAPHDAMRSLLNFGPRLFGRELFQLAVRRFTMYPLGSLVELSSLEQGLVVGSNNDNPMRPWVFVAGGREAWRPSRPRLVDLREQKLIHITRCFAPPEFNEKVVYQPEAGI
jgi:hypothetical protein